MQHCSLDYVLQEVMGLWESQFPTTMLKSDGFMDKILKVVVHGSL
jgi:hypothetical protein